MTALNSLDQDIAAVLRAIDDPEVGVNIVDLGLVYEAHRDGSGIRVAMTATSRSCPPGEFMIEDARAHLAAAFPVVSAIDIALVWTPAWGPERMSEAARAQLSRGGW
jgi:metal-sulfur cluster biosynthetic enzyme